MNCFLESLLLELPPALAGGFEYGFKYGFSLISFESPLSA
jgi:hypothetical protein